MSKGLLFSENRDAVSIRRVVESIHAAVPDLELSVLAPRATSHSDQLVMVLSREDMASAKFEMLVVHGSDSLPNWVLNDALSRPLQSIRRWSEPDGFADYAPYRDKAARVLSVFPGTPFPVTMGSHRRVLELARHLNAEGIYTDLLVMAPGKGEGLGPLEALAPRVHCYDREKVRLPWIPLARRGAERALRRARGIKSKPPELFSERLLTRALDSARTMLRELLESGAYDTVIVNYAWMSGVLEGLPRSVRSRVRWVCDAHDVQFVRNETANEGEWRLGVSFERERQLEIGVLRQYDAVVAISDADAEHLRQVLDPSRVIVAPTGFDYALEEQGAVRASDGGSVRFGFLGGPMAANARAVELIVRQWWPRIREKWPDASLQIAGAICNRGDVRDLCFLEAGISPVGFVPSLAEYYASIDVSLCPVVVQGGLNFKSVESLMAGPVLVTTPLGVHCLGSDVPAVVGECGNEVVDGLSAALGDRQRWARTAREWAVAKFGDASAYGALTEYLRDG